MGGSILVLTGMVSIIISYLFITFIWFDFWKSKSARYDERLGNEPNFVEMAGFDLPCFEAPCDPFWKFRTDYSDPNE